MDNFIKATKGHEDNVTYLKNSAHPLAEGQRVRIIDGAFAGVEGHIRRIQKNKRIVVSLEGISTVMLNFVPRELLEIE